MELPPEESPSLNEDIVFETKDVTEIAHTLMRKGAFTEAEPLLLRELALRQELLGADHLDTAKVHYRLGWLQLKLHRYPEAERSFYQALRIRHRLLGADHGEIAEILSSLGVVAVNRNELADAERLCRSALDMMRRFYGEAHKETGIAYGNLAAAYQHTDKKREAIILYEKALTILETVADSDLLDLTILYHNLAHLYKGSGRVADAVILYQKALLLHERLQYPVNLDTAKIWLGLAIAYIDLNEFHEADILLQQAFPIFEDTFSAEHSQTLVVLHVQAKSQFQQKKYKDFIATQLSILEKQRSNPDDATPDIATTYHNIGVAYLDWGQLADAEIYFKQSLAIREKVLGKKHPDTISSYHHLTILYQAMEKEYKAMGLL